MPATLQDGFERRWAASYEILLARHTQRKLMDCERRNKRIGSRAAHYTLHGQRLLKGEVGCRRGRIPRGGATADVSMPACRTMASKKQQQATGVVVVALPTIVSIFPSHYPPSHPKRGQARNHNPLADLRFRLAPQLPEDLELDLPYPTSVDERPPCYCRGHTQNLHYHCALHTEKNIAMPSAPLSRSSRALRSVRHTPFCGSPGRKVCRRKQSHHNNRDRKASHG